MAQAARRMVDERFTLDRVVDALDGLYRSLAAAHRGPSQPG
jgi:hypothetical protein